MNDIHELHRAEPRTRLRTTLCVFRQKDWLKTVELGQLNCRTAGRALPTTTELIEDNSSSAAAARVRADTLLLQSGLANGYGTVLRLFSRCREVASINRHGSLARSVNPSSVW